MDDPSRRPSFSVSWFPYSTDIFLFHFSHSFYGHTLDLYILKNANLLKKFPIETFNYGSFLHIQWAQVLPYDHTVLQWCGDIWSSHSPTFLLSIGPLLSSLPIVFGTYTIIINMMPLCKYFNSQFLLSLNLAHTTKPQSMYELLWLHTFSSFTQEC